jgi:hypothetical protein
MHTPHRPLFPGLVGQAPGLLKEGHDGLAFAAGDVWASPVRSLVVGSRQGTSCDFHLTRV